MRNFEVFYYQTLRYFITKDCGIWGVIVPFRAKNLAYFRLALGSPQELEILGDPEYVGLARRIAPIAASVTSKNLGLRARTTTDFCIVA